MFLLSTGKAGKFFINELTKLFNAWIDDSPLTKIVMKAVMIMPSLLLQNPSKESQWKDHLKALQWRIELWQSSNPLELLQDSLTIQRNLKSVKAWKTVAKTSKNFVEEMQKENVNGPLKLLTVNIDHRALPLNHNTISKLEMKHLQASAPDPIILLPDEAQNIHPIRHEDITAEDVHKAAINTKGGDDTRCWWLVYNISIKFLWWQFGWPQQSNCVLYKKIVFGKA